MTIARAQLIDSSVTRWYHCVARCVRTARLLGEGISDRKQWIEDRLEQLAGVFAVSVGGFAVLDDQLHVLLRIDPDVAASWTAEEVVRRWGRLFPPRDRAQRRLEVTEEWVEARRKNKSFVASTRQRLWSVGWFMKCLKEPLSRMANREEGVRGAFFEGRFKSVAILDGPSLLATCVYIDLNLGAAGAAFVPKASRHTSIKQRVADAKRARPRKGRKAAPKGSKRGQDASLGTREIALALPVRRSASARQFVARGNDARPHPRSLSAPGRVLEPIAAQREGDDSERSRGDL